MLLVDEREKGSFAEALELVSATFFESEAESGDE